MKYFLFWLFASCLFSSISAQSVDERVGACINQGDFFALDEVYTESKDSIQTPLLRVFAESLLNAVFNRPTDAFVSVDELIAKYQGDIGFENVQSMFSWKNRLLYSEGEYAQAFEEMNGFIEGIKPHVDSTTLVAYNSSNWMNSIMKNVPKSTLIRPQEDVTIRANIIPFDTTDGYTIFVPIEIDGKTEQFIFDTGAQGGAVMSDKFARSHNVKMISDSVNIHGTGAVHGWLGLVDSIRLGEIMYTNLIVAVLPEQDSIDEKYRVEAVLGSAFMKSIGEIQIYPKDQKIVFPINETPLPVSGRNMMMLNDNFYLKAYHNGDRLIMHFDTGNIGSNLHAAYYHKYKSEVERLAYKTTKLSGGIGHIGMTDIYMFPSFDLKLNDTNFELLNVPVNLEQIFVNQGFEDGALGMKFVTLFDEVIINFNQMFVSVK